MTKGDIKYRDSMFVVSGSIDSSVATGDILYQDGGNWKKAYSDGNFSDGEPVGIATESDSTGTIGIMRKGAMYVEKQTGNALYDGDKLPIASATGNAGTADGANSAYAMNAIILDDAASDDTEVLVML